jgi:hypothetical protein
MGRAAKALIGSGVFFLLGFASGIVSSSIYRQRVYPNDPDPVDFTIGAIFLGVWLVIWIFGTLAAIWWAFRKPSANAL